ncbi:GNAT family N-acetyltransferase [Flavobacterium agricola]|uniref:GNAT family N-acetyltransferase n=1 Tax=Flavobacterium agricola TaxID=2870839 RepID=A0ABY6LYY4_9FLAO|nr:GNAT family N-acetyltransferase [Flavobacterium agricola]UYW01496.1 GNAT family N-acetyltransferase [Flavobacterium agricola]
MKIAQVNSETVDWDLLILADPSEEVIASYIDNCIIFQLYEETFPVAVVALLKLNDTEIEIKNIAVDEEYQNQGLGTDLIHFCAKQAKQNGYKKLWIGTGNSSLSQLLLYQKLGFRMSYIKENFFVEHYDEKIVENKIPCLDMVMLYKNL